MLYSKIMVPYDGSEHAKHALEYAKGLAATSDAKIAIVHVVPSGVMGVDQIGTEGSLDGVPFGMLNYEQYEGVVRAALDQAKGESGGPCRGHRRHRDYRCCRRNRPRRGACALR